MTALKDRFQAAFDARDPDDAFFLAEIPKLDPAPLVTYLKTVVAKIQKRPLSAPHWIKFKYECLTDLRMCSKNSSIGLLRPFSQTVRI